MRHLATVSALTAAALALVPSGSIAAGSGSRTSGASCGSRQGHTIKATGSARVYSLNGSAYACALPAGVSYRLGSLGVCNGAGLATPAALAGKLVAYGLQTCGVDSGSAAVILRRLTDGRRVRTDQAISVAPVESLPAVTSLVLKPDGSDAWIVVAHSLGTRKTTIEVHEHNRGEVANMLGSGIRIDPASLRLNGSKLSWRDGGSERHAALS